MAWDSNRPVPWKKLGFYLALYAGIVIAFFALTKPDNLVSAVPGLTVGVILAGTFMVVLIKLGWNMPMLRSREEVAAQRAARTAERSGGSSGGQGVDPDGPRPKPAPTSRTSTGPTQRPRRTTKTRKR
jgi:hypothetical protein